MSTSRNIYIPVPDATEPGIQLTMSMAEANAIASVLALVGGTLVSSRRRHTENVFHALMSAGVEWNCDDLQKVNGQRGLMFLSK